MRPTKTTGVQLDARRVLLSTPFLFGSDLVQPYLPNVSGVRFAFICGRSWFVFSVPGFAGLRVWRSRAVCVRAPVYVWVSGPVIATCVVGGPAPCVPSSQSAQRGGTHGPGRGAARIGHGQRGVREGSEATRPPPPCLPATRNAKRTCCTT